MDWADPSQTQNKWAAAFLGMPYGLFIAAAHECLILSLFIWSFQLLLTVGHLLLGGEDIYCLRTYCAHPT